MKQKIAVLLALMLSPSVCFSNDLPDRNTGFAAPTVDGTISVYDPVKGEIVFDSSSGQNKFWGFNGTSWVDFGNGLPAGVAANTWLKWDTGTDTGVWASLPNATTTSPGMVTLNKFQRKNKSSSQTSGTITEWALSNLTVGKIYRLTINAYIVHTSSSSNLKQLTISTTHTGSTLGNLIFAANPVTDNMDNRQTYTVAFVATATTVSFSVSTTNTTLYTGSFVTIEELNNYEEVSSF